MYESMMSHQENVQAHEDQKLENDSSAQKPNLLPRTIHGLLGHLPSITVIAVSFFAGAGDIIDTMGVPKGC